MRTHAKTPLKDHRTLAILGNPSRDRCDVLIAEEGITLTFGRNCGVIQCISRTKEHPDLPERASRAGFNAARGVAIERMNGDLTKENERADREEPIISFSSIIECSMTYGGSKYSFSCDLQSALTWENLKLSADEHPGKEKLYLLDREYHKLKMRAYGKIQMRRKLAETYGEDGLLPFTPNERTSLAKDAQLALPL
jgi:hypothetical protein